MPFCPTCGKQLEALGSACDACAAGAELTPKPAPAPPLTVAQRALAGARSGALLGALYGGIWGLISAVLLFVFPFQGNRIEAAVLLIVVWAAIGAAALAPLGALLRLIFPGKAKKKTQPAADPASKKDTKIDHT